MAISHHLDLDVAAGFDVALTEDRRISEGRQRFALRCFDFGLQDGQVSHDAHTAATATGGGLDQDWKFFLGDRGGVELGEHGNACVGHHLLGLDLRAHQLDCLGGGSDPRQARVLYPTRKLGVLGEKSVTGVDGVGPRCGGGGDDELTLQVCLRGGVAGQVDCGVGVADMGGAGVGVGEDSDGIDSHAAAGGEDAAGDFAAVGDQYRLDRSGACGVTQLGIHVRLTSGRHRSWRCLRSGQRRWPTGTFLLPCGCHGGR